MYTRSACFQYVKIKHGGTRILSLRQSISVFDGLDSVGSVWSMSRTIYRIMAVYLNDSPESMKNVSIFPILYENRLIRAWESGWYKVFCVVVEINIRKVVILHCFGSVFHNFGAKKRLFATWGLSMAIERARHCKPGTVIRSELELCWQSHGRSKRCGSDILAKLRPG